jgi:hypothetical protein
MRLGLLATGVGFALGYYWFAVYAPVVQQYAVTAIHVGLCAGAAIVLTRCVFGVYGNFDYRHDRDNVVVGGD